jgi:DNA-binding response OmpR family regulator
LPPDIVFKAYSVAARQMSQPCPTNVIVSKLRHGQSGLACQEIVIDLSPAPLKLPDSKNLEQNWWRADMSTILVVEDDSRIQKALQRLFATEGYEVKCAADGNAGLEFFQMGGVDAVVLDLMLPTISGRELCKTMKSASPDKPVIILSAVSEVADKVLLLELGADDYVTKPFSPRELLARVQAAMRRSKRSRPNHALTFGDVSVDFVRMQVTRAGKLIPLTAHEFKLLRFFLDNAERVLTREELLNDVWGYNFYPSTRTVDNQILKLRQKLEVDPANPTHFRTVHGMGYKFVFSPAG